MSDATWLNQSGIYNDPANWDTGVVPDGTAMFSGAFVSNNLSFTAPFTTANSWRFGADFASYGFTLSNKTFAFNGAGIVNDDPRTSVQVTVDFGGELRFFNASAAGHAAITAGASGSITFFDNSTAANARITNDGGVLFAGASTAGSAIIINDGGVFFYGTSEAGNAVITNNDSLEFHEDARAGRASIANNNLLVFFNDSAGDRATISNNAGAQLTFRDSSTAGGAGAVITNDGLIQFDGTSAVGSAAITNRKTLQFLSSSTAGDRSAAITNDDVLQFNDTSTAGSAIIVNNSSLRFFDGSDAGSATIANHSLLRFLDTSTAGAATVSNDGLLQFFDASTAGAAQIVNDAGGIVDFSTSTGPAGDHQLSVGSIAGAGSYLLGSNALTVNGNVTLASGAHLAVELGGAASDQVEVHGGVSLGGAIFDAKLVSGFAPAAGTSLTLIDNDGSDAVIGTFAGLAEGAKFNVGGASFAISYHGGDGNDVVLTAQADHAPTQPIIGTDGDDSFVAPTGDAELSGKRGVDTISFDFRLVDATVTHSGNQIIIDGPNGASHTVLSGFETFVFTDGTVHNRDGNPLIDDLFYYARNHDVWNAHIDADTHFNTFGWKEGRDPNAWFDTKGYLAQYADVKAAGVNPLVHYDQHGWHEGRDPSVAFDSGDYLSHYADVAANGIDPLAHFLTWAGEEGRTPFNDGMWG